MEAIVRPAASGDLQALEQAWPSDGWFEERLHAAVGAACLIVAVVDGKPIAHLDLRAEPYYEVIRSQILCHEINAMLVHLPAHRSCGLGEAMLRFAEERCSSHGVVQLGMAVALDNPPARSLYGRLGYRQAVDPFNPYGKTKPTHDYLTKKVGTSTSVAHRDGYRIELIERA